MSADVALTLDGVSKCFDRRGAGAPTLKRAILTGFRGHGPEERFWALRDVSLDIRVGETVGLIGANGSGKSTLLRLVGGLGLPSRGTIVRHRDVDALMSLGDAFDPLLTGRENAVTAGLLAGYRSRQARAKLDEIVTFSELEEFIDLPLRTYSEGMKLRLAFAVAVSSEPEILLIDEVLSVGDLRFQEKCFDRLVEMQRHGVTIMFASHDESQVRRLCERVVWLSRGRVQACGGADEVYEAYRWAMQAETRRRAAEVPLEARHDGGGLRPDENRFGTFEVEIADVRILREGPDPTRSGDRVGVQVEIDARTAVQDPIVGVSLQRSADGVRVLDLSTDADGVRLGTVEGRRTVTLWLDRLDVEPGEYRLDVGVYERSWTYVFDYHWQAYPLTVGPTRGAGFGPPHGWSVGSPEAGDG